MAHKTSTQTWCGTGPGDSSLAGEAARHSLSYQSLHCFWRLGMAWYHTWGSPTYTHLKYQRQDSGRNILPQLDFPERDDSGLWINLARMCELIPVIYSDEQFSHCLGKMRGVSKTVLTVLQAKRALLELTMSKEHINCMLLWTAFLLTTNTLSLCCQLTKHPNVASCGKPPEVDRLGCHPLNGKLSFWSYSTRKKRE